MTREHGDPYVVLGVGRHASPAEIAHAYRRTARATHPDSSARGAGSAAGFRAASDAYETLRDPERRAAYDRAHPPARLSDTASPPPHRGSVRYAPGGHIVLGAAPPRSPVVQAGPHELAPVPHLLLRLLLRGW
jgi:hypothetical protein